MHAQQQTPMANTTVLSVLDTVAQLRFHDSDRYVFAIFCITRIQTCTEIVADTPGYDDAAYLIIASLEVRRVHLHPGSELTWI